MQFNKTTTILLIILMCTAAYSLLVLHLDDKRESSSPYLLDNQSASAQAESRQKRPLPLPADTEILTDPSVNKSTQQDYSDNELPFLIKLKGLDLAEKLALFEARGKLSEYYVGDAMFNSDIIFINLTANSATLSFNDKTFTVALDEINLMEEEPDPSYEELIEMSPDDIGTRPQIVEHIVKLTPTPFIADGMIASPGLNPTLFEQAGLVEDDVIKTINGLSVTNEDEFARLQRMMPKANTLVIVVERRGRLITRYLDIPSEALELKR